VCSTGGSCHRGGLRSGEMLLLLLRQAECSLLWTRGCRLRPGRDARSARTPHLGCQTAPKWKTLVRNTGNACFLSSARRQETLVPLPPAVGRALDKRSRAGQQDLSCSTAERQAYGPAPRQPTPTPPRPDRDSPTPTATPTPAPAHLRHHRARRRRRPPRRPAATRPSACVEKACFNSDGSRLSAACPEKLAVSDGGRGRQLAAVHLSDKAGADLVEHRIGVVAAVSA
jgi:hypothetical protein